MRKDVPEMMKRLVASRAKYRCEYCLLHESVSFYTFHIEHIRSLKHDGLTLMVNLAYSCPDCNHFKGSDVGGYSTAEQLVRFFNPRIDIWNEHFELQNGAIYGKTEIGEATERIFKFNDFDRLIFRRQLIALSRYP